MSDQSDIEEPGIAERKDNVRLGHVYRMESEDGYFYYGSTQNSLKERFRYHRKVSNLPIDRQSPAIRHFGTLGWDNVKIFSVLELVSTRDDLYRAEGAFIIERLSDPKCLNQMVSGRFETHRERYERTHAERDIVREVCECGETIFRTCMKRHLSGELHARNMILKTMPDVVEKKPIIAKITCSCGVELNSFGLPLHLKTERHLWNMRMKQNPLPKFPTPDPIKTPEGMNPKKTYCRCPCGMIVSRRDFKPDHENSLAHFKGLVNNGTIKLAEENPTDNDIEDNKVLCECGARVGGGYLSLHFQSLAHKMAMRLKSSDKANVTENEIVKEPVKKLPGSLQKMTCECGITLVRKSLTLHLSGDQHARRMLRKEQGLPPSPVRGLEKRKEMIECPCGAFIRHGNKVYHGRSKIHKDAMEAKATE